MTYAEISNFLGVSENTIKSRLRRARQQLKKYEFMVPEALDITIEAEHRCQKHLSGDFGMKLTFERDDLLYSLQVLQGVASGQDTSPIPSNVLIHAEGNTIECMATDMEIGIRMKVEGTVREEGSFTVSAHWTDRLCIALPAPIGTATTNGRVEIAGEEDVYIVEVADEEFLQAILLLTSKHSRWRHLAVCPPQN